MLVSFPHMGRLHFALEKVFRIMELPYIVPPFPGPSALHKGSELAPEGSCLPFCLVLGNMCEALERGADTLVMLGGSGPCRFGYFVYLAEKILLDAGYDFKMLIIDKGYYRAALTQLRKERKVSWVRLAKAVQRGWQTVVWNEILDRIERELLPRTENFTDGRVYVEKSREILVGAQSDEDFSRIENMVESLLEQITLLPASEALIIGLVGDIYTMLEPYANQGVEEFLLKRGVCVYKEMAVSRWFPNILLPWRRNSYRNRLLKLASPYLSASVGGFGLESVAGTQTMSQYIADGVIQLFPLGCMPEIVARSALSSISIEKNLPLLSLTLDCHDSVTGLVTRLEAFLEMVAVRKKKYDSFNFF
jgi:predicted nucleotide-binding protein (sugar kinase/HSP70/actin superfamily)